jgi:hypothetical protein
VRGLVGTLRRRAEDVGGAVRRSADAYDDRRRRMEEQARAAARGSSTAARTDAARTHVGGMTGAAIDALCRFLPRVVADTVVRPLAESIAHAVWLALLVGCTMVTLWLVVAAPKARVREVEVVRFVHMPAAELTATAGLSTTGRDSVVATAFSPTARSSTVTMADVAAAAAQIASGAGTLAQDEVTAPQCAAAAAAIPLTSTANDLSADAAAAEAVATELNRVMENAVDAGEVVPFA